MKYLESISFDDFCVVLGIQFNFGLLGIPIIKKYWSKSSLFIPSGI